LARWRPKACSRLAPNSELKARAPTLALCADDAQYQPIPARRSGKPKREIQDKPHSRSGIGAQLSGHQVCDFGSRQRGWFHRAHGFTLWASVLEQPAPACTYSFEFSGSTMPFSAHFWEKPELTFHFLRCTAHFRAASMLASSLTSSVPGPRRMTGALGEMGLADCLRTESHRSGRSSYERACCLRTLGCGSSRR